MKNKFMRIAAVMLMLCLVTTCAISGTFAKYTTEASGSDTARVAYWGFNKTNAVIDIDDLFINTYTSNTTGYTKDTVIGKNDADVIAPGTTNTATFKFAYTDGVTTAPEVAYKMTIDLSECDIAPTVDANKNIKWALYKSGTTPGASDWGTWNQMLDKIGALAGNTTSAAAEDTTTADLWTATHDANSALPDITTSEWVIAWQWVYEGGAGTDADDTNLGNSTTALNVKVVIKVNATQLD